MSERRTYFRKARSWAEDCRAQADRSRRTAWTIAGVAVGAAALEAVALAMLAPLKTVQPITLLVDRQTGFVQALDPNTPHRVSADAALTDAMLAQYVVAREAFDRSTIRRDYRRVALWSTGQARSVYLAGMSPANPASPLQAYPAGTTVAARIRSVSRLGSGLSLVRFDTQRLARDGQAQAPQPWISVVRFRYSDAPMSFADRLENPLGFQVSGYRRDAEAPPVQDPKAPAVSNRGSSEPVDPAPDRPDGRYVADRRSRLSPGAARSSRGVTGSAGMARREVPIDQLPLGSPLMPDPSPATLPGGRR